MPVATIRFMLDPREVVAARRRHAADEKTRRKKSTIPEPGNGAVLSGKRAGNWAGWNRTQDGRQLVGVTFVRPDVRLAPTLAKLI